MSARKPSGCAAGLFDLNNGLKARTVALIGLLWAGDDATQWMKLENIQFRGGKLLSDFRL